MNWQHYALPSLAGHDAPSSEKEAEPIAGLYFFLWVGLPTQRILVLIRGAVLRCTWEEGKDEADALAGEREVLGSDGLETRDLPQKGWHEGTHQKRGA